LGYRAIELSRGASWQNRMKLSRKRIRGKDLGAA
jgi:hypothetical protein